MPKLWTEMTVEEKLDDLHSTVQHLTDAMNASADRGNRRFAEIERQFETTAQVLATVGAAIAVLQGNSGGSL